MTSRLAFTSSTRDLVNRNVPNPPAPTPVTAELYVVNADGSDKRLLARSHYLGPPVPARAAWSPDGQTIAFTDYSRLLLINADGSGQRDVTRELRLGQLPVWSPDGHKIALVRCRGGQRCDIYVMNADGGGLRRLTRKPRVRISELVAERQEDAFLSRYPLEVWVMDADGRSPLHLARRGRAIRSTVTSSRRSSRR